MLYYYEWGDFSKCSLIARLAARELVNFVSYWNTVHVHLQKIKKREEDLRCHLSLMDKRNDKTYNT